MSNQEKLQYRDEVRVVLRETQWTIWMVAIKIVPLLLLLSVILGAVSWAIGIMSRPAQVVDKVLNSDKIIQNYEWFEESYNDAKSLDQQIVNTQLQVETFQEGLGPRDGWSRVDRTEFNRLNTVLLGLRNQRNNIVSAYNAKSNMVTRNLFKGQNLPYHLAIANDATQEEWVK